MRHPLRWKRKWGSTLEAVVAAADLQQNIDVKAPGEGRIKMGSVVAEKIGPLYFEDLEVGQKFRSETYVMDAKRIKEFAAEFDPQSFHLDETAATASVFRGLAASGWHTAAVAMRLLTTSGLNFANGILGLGGEISWPRPTRPGDTLCVESEIVEIRPSQSKPQGGIVTLRSTMVNQNGEAVYLLTAKLLVARRPRGIDSEH